MRGGVPLLRHDVPCIDVSTTHHFTPCNGIQVDSVEPHALSVYIRIECRLSGMIQELSICRQAQCHLVRVQHSFPGYPEQETARTALLSTILFAKPLHE